MSDQLEELRAKLRALLNETRLSQYDFARAVLGCNERTLQRWLAGEGIPYDRARWLENLEMVEPHGTHVIVIVRCCPPVRRKPKHFLLREVASPNES